MRWNAASIGASSAITRRRRSPLAQVGETGVDGGSADRRHEHGDRVREVVPRGGLHPRRGQHVAQEGEVLAAAIGPVPRPDVALHRLGQARVGVERPLHAHREGLEVARDQIAVDVVADQLRHVADPRRDHGAAAGGGLERRIRRTLRFAGAHQDRAVVEPLRHLPRRALAPAAGIDQQQLAGDAARPQTLLQRQHQIVVALQAPVELRPNPQHLRPPRRRRPGHREDLEIDAVGDLDRARQLSAAEPALAVVEDPTVGEMADGVEIAETARESAAPADHELARPAPAPERVGHLAGGELAQQEHHVDRLVAERRVGLGGRGGIERRQRDLEIRRRVLLQREGLVMIRPPRDVVDDAQRRHRWSPQRARASERAATGSDVTAEGPRQAHWFTTENTQGSERSALAGGFSTR
ncbi:MAG: hypothetical protein U0802_22900 [Candidatus Binatia bacterium]